ncbi:MULTISPECIES: HAD family hydrolase [unclassified Sphingomonas]|uniref:HAD family hydrolase n=1 Tax=unclassified Sphingomonas TaxID=196159 RepID=UPI000FEFDA65|nr:MULTISPECIES: HAD family hydrolase [unclassified Sphingomonas]RKE42412.1 HAD superfamily hydrolase (TIGR01493 family)/HAD superfamily hydrolase (TIGR01549 family) [Sphingomonas sp. PP-CC-1A-547]TCM03763.1 HAD superfamily hydrolase (TIGR01493 family)/HAD superfamily hydrolase (TIGR01549 family) [Sphingomonas sp. PP-CC-3G-468]
MSDALPSFRTPAEQAVYAAVLHDLAGRDRGDKAVMVFREPTDPDAAVVADAMIRAGRVSDTLYARLLAAADRLYASPPVTRAVAFDAFGTLVHIGRKRHPFERLIRQARDQAQTLPSPMAQLIDLADYAAALGLPHPDAELAMLDQELATIALFPDTLDALRRVREQGVRIAVASNLALPYAFPLKALLGDLVDIWHFSFDAGVIKPDRAFYAGLTARLGCEASELLMVGDTWRDDIVGAVEAVSRARWIDREGCASHARRFIAARELGDAYPDRRRAGQMTELELVRSSIDANLNYLHTQRWALQAARLRQTLKNAPEAEKAAAKRVLDDHYDTRGQPETSRAPLMRNAIVTIAARKHA